MAVQQDANSTSPGFQTDVSSILDTSLTIGNGSNRLLIYVLGFGWSTYSEPTGISGLIGVGFSGSTGVGPVNITGLLEGDKLLWLQSPNYNSNLQSASSQYFEIEVSADNQLQQLINADLTDWTFNAVFSRGV